MQKYICLYRQDVDNDIIDSCFEVNKKKLRNREDREKNCLKEKIDDLISSIGNRI